MSRKWKDIPGYEGLYQVSDDGKVKSMPRYTNGTGKGYRFMPGGVMGTARNTQGYEHVGLMKDGKRKTIAIHVLVAKAFIPKPDGKLEVNHINGIKDDNRVENLEWVSRSENQKHAYRNGLNKITKERRLSVSGEKQGQSKLTKEQVLQIRSIYEQGFASQREIGEAYGVDQSQISYIVNRKHWNHI